MPATRSDGCGPDMANRIIDRSQGILGAELQNRADEIFRATVTRPRSERLAFAEAACEGDNRLFAMVETMLSVDEDLPLSGETQAISTTVGATGAKPAVYGQSFSRIVDSEDLSGTRFGNYELLRRVGKGGMGSVYAARRADQDFKKLVAIKFVKPGMETEEILLRFKHERQVLAGLDHPNISRLLDGGTDQGVPFLVMEYVEGVPIDDYCRDHRLSVQARLQLFCIVCSALQYAHQSLVVHRDIKPTNILVTADGTPKLLDFGIAKVLNPDLSETMAMTTASGVPMTPDFASPEQVRGDAVTTSSDVYALGVLLYELLTTEHPLRHYYKKLGFERTVLEAEPDRPSTAASRATTEPGLLPENSREKLQAKLRGDLDAILLMSLRKEPPRRYASVQHFADDIQRYLTGSPVRAQRDTFRYRAGKFVRRNAPAVIAATLAVLLLIASSIISYAFYRQASRERFRAEARFADVRQLARFVLFDFDRVIEAGSTPARQAVIEKATEYLGRLEKDRTNDPSLERELVEGYLKVGDLYGNLYGANLGNRTAAKESYERALKVLDSSKAADVRLLTETRVRLADLLASSGALQDAIKAYQGAKDVLERGATSDPNTNRTLITLLRNLASAQSRVGDYPGALKSYEDLVTHNRALQSVDPNSPDIRAMAALADLRIGELKSRMGNVHGLPQMERALRVYTELLDAAPNSPTAQRGVAMSSGLIGDVLLLANRYKEASEHFRTALDATDEMVKADPKNQALRRDQLLYMDRLADTLAKSGDVGEARALTKRLLATLRAGVEKSDASAFELYQYTWSLLTTQFKDLRDPASAKKFAQKLIEMSKGQDVGSRDLLARAYAGTGSFARAVEIETEALSMLPRDDSDLRKELEANLKAFQAGKDAPAEN
jgi:non-specific serine/threonine protein kinase/serine/threonine-protein kinase